MSTDIETQPAADKETTAPGVRPGVGYQVKSYRYLRIAIIGLLLSLGAAVIYQQIHLHCSLGSASAYFYTTARSVWVGGLVGLGVGMLALRGMNLPEDIFLNLGGIFAFLVAFVPTPGGSASCQTHDKADSVSASIHDSLFVLIIVGALALLAAFALLLAGYKRRSDSSYRWAWAEWIAVLALWAGIVIAVERFPGWTVNDVHSIAATSLAVCVIAVAGANVYRKRADWLRSSYTWIAGSMVFFSILLLILAVTKVITVFWLELSVAAMFIVFWSAQTIQLELESNRAGG